MSESGKLFLTNKQEPFETEAAAKAAQRKVDGETVVIPYKTGFALRGVVKEDGQEKPKDTGEKPKTSRPDRNAILSQKRTRRKEMDARDPLETHKIPGMVMRWVRDTEREGGRKILQRVNRGWSFVELQDGVPTAVYGDVNRGSISDRYVTMPGGNGATLYLMAIEEELFQEDTEAKKAKLDNTTEQIRKAAMHPDIEGSGLSWKVTNPKPI